MIKEIVETMTIKEREEFNAASKALSTGELVYDPNGNCLFCDDYVSDFDYETGATKVCILVKGMVLKTSYNAEFEDYGDVYAGEEETIRQYTNEDDVDYAAVEAMVYQRVVSENVEKFFAEIESIGNGVYAQRKVRNIGTIPEYYVPSYEHLKAIDLIDEFNLDGIPEGFILSSLEAGITIEELQELSYFITKYDINDLHDGNMGWLDGHPVFFDYCGFCSSTSHRVRKEI